MSLDCHDTCARNRHHSFRRTNHVLDMTHQIEILDLLFELNEKEQRTIVMVLHDINLACLYAQHIVAIHNRNVFAQGKPEDIVNADMVRSVFQIECEITVDPLFGTPLCIPYGKGRKVSDGK